MKTLTIILAIVASAAIGLAQDLLPASPPQTGGVMLVGGTVHTVSGETIENGVVGFRDGRITVVADAAIMSRISLTDDTRVIDIAGRHVYPGLIAAATRLGLTETESVRATHDYNETGGFTPEVRAVVAVNPDSTLIPVARLNGVLLAGVAPSGGRIPGRAGVIRLHGWTWEDMTVRAEAGLVLAWPSVRTNQGPWRSERGDDEDRIKRDLDAISRFFDDAGAYARAVDAGADLPVDLRLSAMRPYLGEASGEGARPVFIAADDYDQIVSAVSFAQARGLRAVIVGGRDAHLCTELLKAADTAVVIDGTYRFPKRADSPHDEAYALPARLHAAGVRFCITGSDRDGNVRNLPHEAGMAARYGLEPAAAVRAITLGAAEILGVAEDYGSLEQGKSATLIVTTGDVLEITTNLEHAFIEGRSIDLRSKQTDLRDKFVEKYRQLGIISE